MTDFDNVFIGSCLLVSRVTQKKTRPIFHKIRW